MVPVVTPAVPAAPTPKAPTASAPVTPAPVAPTPSASQVRESLEGIRSAQARALPGIGVSIWSAGGQRQAVSDANGVVSLGQLRAGRHELSVNQENLGAGNGNQPVAIALLLPAVQSVREGARRFVTVVVTPVNDPPTLQIKVDVDAKGQVSAVNWGNGIGVNVAAGDVNGDGRADLKNFEDLALRNPSGETRLAFVAPLAGSGGGPAAVQAGVVIGVLAAFRPLPNVGITATGPGGVMQLHGDSQGVTPLGRLPVGTTRVEFNGEQVAATLRSIGGPTPSTPGVPAGFRGVPVPVVIIMALKADGGPVVSIRNGDALPNKLQALLRIGRDGNLMDVDWGSGPQPVQALTKVGVGTLSMTGSGGPIPVSPALLKMLQDRASKMTPGLVEANTAIGEISTTR